MRWLTGVERNALLSAMVGRGEPGGRFCPCNVCSPVCSAKTMPFATDGASGTVMSGEVQAGVRDGVPPFATNSNAIMLPFGICPLLCANGGTEADGGPHIG